MVAQTNMMNGYAYGAVQTVSVGASPYTFVNPESTQIMLAVSVGTVTAISVSVDGSTFISTGLLGGNYLLNPGHSIQITYAVAPTVKYWPI